MKYNTKGTVRGSRLLRYNVRTHQRHVRSFGLCKCSKFSIPRCSHLEMITFNEMKENGNEIRWIINSTLSLFDPELSVLMNIFTWELAAFR